MLAKRYGISLALGAVVTTILFLIMQAVIASDEAKLDEGAKGKLLELVRLEDDEEIQTKQRKPKPPPPPDEPPPEHVALSLIHISEPTRLLSIGVCVVGV